MNGCRPTKIAGCSFTDGPTRITVRSHGVQAVVTGASSGIGLELAQRLAEAGLNLVINARRVDELEKVAYSLTAATGVNIRVVAADVSDPVGVQQVID